MVGLEHVAALEADLNHMDHRLKIWGLWCRIGSIGPILWDTDDSNGLQLTTYQVRDANKLQLMIMRLPILHRMTVQVHYVDRGDNDEIGPRRKWNEVNARLRAAGEDRLIGKNEYPRILERALRIIINSERVMKV